MAKKLDQITDGELAILRILWERNVATTREIAEAIYPEVNDPKMASVQKLIERMEGKGCVERDRGERRIVFVRSSTRKSSCKAVCNRWPTAFATASWSICWRRWCGRRESHVAKGCSFAN